MYLIVIVVVLATLFYYFVMYKNGNLSFWKKVAKNPDLFYEMTLNNEAWIIDDGKHEINKTKYDGPFSLYVPCVGKTIKYYGKIGKYIESERVIEKQL